MKFMYECAHVLKINVWMYVLYRGRESLSGGGANDVGGARPVSGGGGMMAEKKNKKQHYNKDLFSE